MTSPKRAPQLIQFGFQHFRRRDPVDADETEFMDNLFDALCSALNEPSIKSQFASAEGHDLMVLMMK
jgi:beta-catenin-like protein 1